MSGSTMVFVGRVLVDSGEGYGSRPARILIEERLFNTPSDLIEVDVHSSYGTSCYFRLKEGERYVLFASKQEGQGDRLIIGACSNTFNVQGNEHILDALRNKAKGGPPRLVGTVRRSSGPYLHERGVAGARVIVEGPEVRSEGLSDAFGNYEIRALTAGRYTIEVMKDGFVADSEYNRRWSGRLVMNQAKNKIEPDNSAPGTIVISDKSCEVWDLSMWPAGLISGTVRGSSRQPVSGVTVQAFGHNRNGRRESTPLRTASTDSFGRYALTPLPGGDYVVGVNAQTYRDEDPYPPTVYNDGKTDSLPSVIRIGDGERVDGIDLTLPAKRTPATLRVTVMGLGGGPQPDATVTLDNLAGVQRWYSNDETGEDGNIDIPVFVGEEYVLNATDFHRSRISGDYDYLGGKARVRVTGERTSIVVVLAPQRFGRDK